MSVDLTNGEGTSNDHRFNHMVTKLKELSTDPSYSQNEPNNVEPDMVKSIVVAREEDVNETDSSSSESDENSSDDEPIHAPIELLSEFLQYVRTGHWEDAAKLCKMILIYEPDNHEALRFGPLIEEKIQVEKELAEEESEESSEEETSDESDDQDQEENEDNEEESDSSSENEEERLQHLPNRLVFPQYQPVWKP